MEANSNPVSSQGAIGRCKGVGKDKPEGTDTPPSTAVRYSNPKEKGTKRPKISLL